MRVLWIGDVVLPDFCYIFGIKRTVIAGWMTGALTGMSNYTDMEIGLCFPIMDIKRMRDGIANGQKYYSFEFRPYENECNEELIDRFIEIFEDFKPDVIHVWGTEYVHSLSVLRAAERKNIRNRVLITIQGLVSIYSKHYLVGIREKDTKYDAEVNEIIAESVRFAKQGRPESIILKEGGNFSGRTEWDKACVLQNNCKSKYYYIPEIMRPQFYKCSGKWNSNKCIKYSIFFSQAHYSIKGLHILIEALNIVVTQFPETTLIVAGRDVLRTNDSGMRSAYGSYLNKLIKEYKLEERVGFTGFLDETHMVEEYSKANVFVCSSTIENSSNSVCEAMLIGTPVVASCVGGMLDLIDNGESGFIFDVNAPYMLAHYICKIFEDETLASKLSIEATKRISQKLNREVAEKIMYNTYFELYNA